VLQLNADRGLAHTLNLLIVYVYSEIIKCFHMYMGKRIPMKRSKEETLSETISFRESLAFKNEIEELKQMGVDVASAIREGARERIKNIRRALDKKSS